MSSRPLAHLPRLRLFTPRALHRCSMLMTRIKPITVYNLALLAVEPLQKSPGHADDGNPLQLECRGLPIQYHSRGPAPCRNTPHALLCGELFRTFSVPNKNGLRQKFASR